jgi:hypothetical protein
VTQAEALAVAQAELARAAPRAADCKALAGVPVWQALKTYSCFSKIDQLQIPVGSSAKEVILLMFLSCNCDVFFCFLGLIVTVIILVVRPDVVVIAHFSTYELLLPVILPEVCEHVQGTLEGLHKYWFAWAPTSNGLCCFLLACTDYLEVFAGVSSTTNCSTR